MEQTIRVLCLRKWKGCDITEIKLGDKTIALGYNDETVIFIWAGGEKIFSQVFEDKNIKFLNSIIDIIIKSVSKMYNIDKNKKTQNIIKNY